MSRSHTVFGRRTNAFCLNDETLRAAGVRSFTLSTGPREDAGLSPNTNQNTVNALMTMQAEMAPMEDNRVTLSDDIDAIGQPKANVEFQFRANAMLPTLWRLAGERFLREGLGRFTAPGPIIDITGLYRHKETVMMAWRASLVRVNNLPKSAGMRSLHRSH